MADRDLWLLLVLLGLLGVERGDCGDGLVGHVVGS